MELYLTVRRAHFQDGLSRRQIARDFGICRIVMPVICAAAKSRRHPCALSTARQGYAKHDPERDGNDNSVPEAFATLQRFLEARQGKPGKREYVQVLRLLERFEMMVLHGAVKDALQMGAISFDAIKHLVLCRVERRPPRLDLDVYPFQPNTTVAPELLASQSS